MSLWFVVAVVLYLYAFWCLYIAIMGLYRASLSGRLIGATKVLAYPLVFVGLAVDVFTQYTLATVFFADLPAKGEYLVTSRLQRYMTQPGTRRYALSKWVCSELLDVFDPTGAHCD